jgi:hypothetical protein
MFQGALEVSLVTECPVTNTVEPSGLMVRLSAMPWDPLSKFDDHPPPAGHVGEDDRLREKPAATTSEPHPNAAAAMIARTPILKTMDVLTAGRRKKTGAGSRTTH